MTRPKGPTKRPKLPPWGFEYAMIKAQELRKKYPKGLTGHEVGIEFGCSGKTAVGAMNRHDFYAFDRRFCWEDVAVMLLYRQVMRLRQIHELFD